MAFVIHGQTTCVLTGAVVDSWETEQAVHGWKRNSDFMGMVKERKSFNKLITVTNNGYSQISDCGKFKQKIEVK